MTLKYQVCAVAHGSWNCDGSAIIERDCGHAHRTIIAAARCMRALKFGGYAAGETRAIWYHACIRHADHSKLSEAEFNAAEDARWAIQSAA